MTVEQILFNWVPAVYLDVFGDEAIVQVIIHLRGFWPVSFNFPTLCVIKRGMGCA